MYFFSPTVDTSPLLNAFAFDLNRGELTLTFSDIIAASSFNASAITLQSAPTRQEAQWHTLTQSITSSPDGSMIVAQLFIADLNEIKRINNLCTAASNCFITVTPYVARDVNGLQTIAITDGNALPVTSFNADTTRPELITWDLDIDNGILSLTFSETVDAFSLQSTELTLQSTSAVSSLTESVFLTNATLLSSSAPFIAISLTENDLNAIKRYTNLGTSTENSFLSITETFISDTNGNPIEPISSSAAQFVMSFQPDMTQPELLSFTINITSGLLSFTFSETVNVSSFNASGLTLVNGQPITDVNGELQPVSNYTLTSGTLRSEFNDPVVVFALSQQDLNAIIATNSLATSVNGTYITATSLTIFDMSQNPLLSIPLFSPLQASSVYYGEYE